MELINFVNMLSRGRIPPAPNTILNISQLTGDFRLPL